MAREYLVSYNIKSNGMYFPRKEWVEAENSCEAQALIESQYRDVRNLLVLKSNGEGTFSFWRFCNYCMILFVLFLFFAH